MEMHDILAALEKRQQRAVLATIIHVEGHAYRKPGVSMVFWSDGSQLGHLSPGCLETDLAEHVQQIALGGETGPRVVDYDMRPTNDLSWSEAIGCGGLVRILLEPVEGRFRECLMELKMRLDLGESTLLVRRMDPSNGQLRSYELLTTIVPETSIIQQAIESPIAAGLEKGMGVTLEFTYHPKPRVVIFGAGPDAVPVANGAIKAGFRVVVADWRQVLCSSEAFNEAVERITAFPNQLVPQLQLNAVDYLVIMSHQLQRDREFLELVLPTPLAYLGVLGSISRTEQLLEGKPAPAWFHAPIGLEIGAQGAEEIAFSIDLLPKPADPQTFFVQRG